MRINDIQVEDSVSPALADLIKRCGNLNPVLKDFGEFYMNEIDLQFVQETDPYGKPWTPLTTAYKNYKTKKGFIPKILQRRGHMRTRAGYQATRDELRIDFNDDKAKWHDRGTSRMPARQLLPDTRRGLPQRVQQELEASLLDYLM